MDNRILSLSGGNQQKVLFARALATRAPVVLMDDPMRGVDVGTKQEVYAIIREEAARGRTFIWYSTEMDEVRLCDRVYVFREGRITAELAGDAVNEKNIIAASFEGVAACFAMALPYSAISRNGRTPPAVSPPSLAASTVSRPMARSSTSTPKPPLASSMAPAAIWRCGSPMRRIRRRFRSGRSRGSRLCWGAYADRNEVFDSPLSRRGQFIAHRVDVERGRAANIDIEHEQA